MRIAVDFDGTIVEHDYPQIGKELPFAFQTLIELQRSGHHILLWTYRSGKELNDAVRFCKSKGLEFYAVNSNYPEEIFNQSVSRKIDADIYIDDKNFGGFPGWDKIWEMFSNDKILKDLEDKRKGKTLFRRLFGQNEKD